MDKKDFQNAIKYLMLATLDKESESEAVVHLSNIYHYELKLPKAGHFWDVRGAELELDVCRNELALDELFKKGDTHFAKAAALFSIGKVSGNEFAEKCLEDILQKEYDRLRSLADHNNADALFTLGLLGCMEAETDHPNIPIGLNLLKKAAEHGSTEACFFLGNIHRIGKIAKKDMKKALEWYRKGAELGDPASAEWAALILCHEPEFKGTTPAEYKKVFDKAIELEVMTIVYEYAQIMEHLAKDMKKAEELYRLSAANGDASSMVRLHYLLIDTNENESFDFLRQALDKHNFLAFLRQGALNQMWKSPRHAFSSFLQAYLNNDKEIAPCELAKCYLTGYGCEVNLDAFWKLANESYKNKNPDACYLLGSVYLEGKICAKDKAKAKAYFEEGAKAGNEDCKKALKEL